MKLLSEAIAESLSVHGVQLNLQLCKKSSLQHFETHNNQFWTKFQNLYLLVAKDEKWILVAGKTCVDAITASAADCCRTDTELYINVN